MPDHQTTAAPGADDTPREMFTPSQIRKLKIAVIGMAVLLLFGFALVIGRIIYLVNRTPASTAAPAAAVRPQAGNAKTYQPLALPRGAVIRNISIGRDHLAVQFESPSGSGIRLMSLATGVWSSTSPVIEGDATPARP
ncbi:MAG: hypothetical protein ACK5JT_20420 [Hyphomicrobiaceae bacterium]